MEVLTVLNLSLGRDLLRLTRLVCWELRLLESWYKRLFEDPSRSRHCLTLSLLILQYVTPSHIQIKNIFIFVIQVLFGLKNFKFPIHSLWTKTSAILKKLVWPVKNTQFRALKSCYSFGNLSGNWIVKFISFILGRPEESSPGEEAEVGSDLCNSSEWSKARQPYLRSGRMRARQTSQERVRRRSHLNSF